MRRRDILAGGGSLAASATLRFPTPALAQGTRQLKMVTDWPAGSPGLQSSAERLAQRIGTASDNRIKIQVFPAGTFVGPFETFDAVGAGVADMYHSAEYYWEKKSAAFSFFAAVPFGFTANELFAWVHYGGEWVGPWLDMALGLRTVANYYYYPGFHEPSAGQTLGINKRLWESFDTSERQVIEDAAAAEYTRALAEFNANNARGLRQLRDQGSIKILKFSDSVLKELYRVSKDVVTEAGSGDHLSKKIYASYQQFLPAIIDWSDIAEGAVLSSRRVV